MRYNRKVGFSLVLVLILTSVSVQSLGSKPLTDDENPAAWWMKLFATEPDNHIAFVGTVQDIGLGAVDSYSGYSLHSFFTTVKVRLDEMIAGTVSDTVLFLSQGNVVFRNDEGHWASATGSTSHFGFWCLPQDRAFFVARKRTSAGKGREPQMSIEFMRVIAPLGGVNRLFGTRGSPNWVGNADSLAEDYPALVTAFIQRELTSEVLTLDAIRTALAPYSYKAKSTIGGR